MRQSSKQPHSGFCRDNRHKPFPCCKKPSVVEVNKGSNHFASLEGTLFDKKMARLIFCSRSKSGVYKFQTLLSASIFLLSMSVDIDFYRHYKFSFLYWTISLRGLSQTCICLDLIFTQSHQENLFTHCPELCSVTIGDRVEKIESSAFSRWNEIHSSRRLLCAFKKTLIVIN